MAFQSNSSGDQAMSEINVTPLVDVMMVLMIVFLVTAPLLTQAVKIDLPETVETNSSGDSDDLQISLDAQGEIYLNTERVPLKQLAASLAQQKAEHPNLKAQFHADAAVPYGQVAKVLAIAQAQSITQIGLVTVEEASP